MSANKFEKSVQQKMEELQLDPSGEVWQEVERRIRKEKKRRGMFFWLLLGTLLLGGASTLFIIKNKSESEPIAKAKQDSNEPNTFNKKETTTGDTTTASSSNNNTNHINELEFDKKKSGQPTFSIRQSKRSVKPREIQGKEKNEEITKPIIAEEPGNEVPGISNEKPAEQSTEVADSVSSANSIVTINKEDSTKINDTTALGLQPAKPGKKNKKASWGFYVQGGVSKLVNGFDIFSRQEFSNALTLGGSPTGPAPPDTAILKPGPSFATGFYHQLNLSPRFTLRTSFSYSFLSFNGNQYASNRSFHFLGVAPELSWKFVGGKKLNLFWDNAIGYKWLMYSSTPYNNLNRHYLFLSTGISVPVTRYFSLRPFAEYGVTPLSNTKDTRAHFLNWGLRINF
jgi:hypothetical protein